MVGKTAHLALVALATLGSPLFAQYDPELQKWEHATARPVANLKDRHVIHSYFNTSPESPDGKYVLYYTSGTRNGESGDIRILERATGKETILASGITAEDAHRAACQQWSDDGKTVLYHDVRDGRWRVMAVNVKTGQQRVLAENRQLGFGSPTGKWAPIYGCHWNPGEHRDLELVNVETGEIKSVVRIEEVVDRYGDWITKQFGTKDVSIFFPVMSPDGSRVFFKIARPSGGNDFRSKSASYRQGKVVYDLEKNELVRLVETWGHPSWSWDGKLIFEKNKTSLDPISGKIEKHAPSSISDHPSISPNGKVFVTDADVTKRPFGKPGYWAIAVGSMTKDQFVIVDLFDNTQGAKTWRHNHPHPAFNALGNRIYYNVNAGPWTQLIVAEINDNDSK